MRAVLLVLALAGSSLAQDDACKTTFLCTDEHCSSTCAPTECHVPENEECVGILLPLYDNSEDVCGCCPWRCVTYLKEGEYCQNKLDAPYPSEMCGAQLACIDGICVRAETPCLLALTAYEEKLANGELGMNMSPPDCDEHGYYEPVQCQRGGFCHCVDRDTGEYIFGLSGSETESKAEGQRCDCARNYHEGLIQGCRMVTHFNGDVAAYEAEYTECMKKAKASSAVDNVYFPGYMRCVANGNYDVIQCVSEYTSREDMCFCVDDQVSVNGTITFQSLTTDLKCYDPDVHKPNYFQPCEMEAFEMRAQQRRMTEDEDRIYYDGGWAPNCTPDGYYGKVQHDREDFSRMFCVDRDGEMLEDYEAVFGSEMAEEMNCECAFARRYVGEGMAKPTCEANGNYRPDQCRNGECYCVNKWGVQIDKEIDQFDFEGCDYLITTPAPTTVATPPT